MPSRTPQTQRQRQRATTPPPVSFHNSTTRSCSPLHFLNPGNLKLSSSLSPSPSSSPSSSSSSSSSSPSHHHHHLSLLPSHSLPSLKSHLPSPPSRKPKRSPTSSSHASADISRLLDPSYTPHHAHAHTPAYAYVDAQGEVHDPDYRDFPLMTTSSASSSPTRAHHHRASSSGTGNTNGIRSMASSSSMPVSHHKQKQNRGRPQFDWEVELDESALDDEYGYASTPGGGESAYTYQPRYVSTNTASWTSTAPPLSGYTYAQYAEQAKQGAGYRPRDASISTVGTGASSTMYSPTGTASTLPTSYEDEESVPIGMVEKTKGRKLAKRNSDKERVKAKMEKEKERLRLVEEEAEKEREKERVRLEEEKEAQRLREEEEAEAEAEEERQKAIQRRRRSTGSYDLERRTTTGSSSVYTPARSSFSRTRGSRRTRMIDALEVEDALRHDLEDEREEEEAMQERRRMSGEGKRKSVDRHRAVFVEDVDDAEEEAYNEAEDEESSGLHHRIHHLSREKSAEYVPTCTQSLKRQWQALALSVRFGVFRAQRRVMRRVASIVN